MSDTLNLQSGLNQLQAKTYNLSGVISIPSGAQIVGVPGQTILNNASGTDGFSYHITGDNVSLQGIIFQGGGVFIDKTSGMNQNILIDNCEFHLNAVGANNNCITFTSGLQNSQITNNLFTNYTGGFGIYGYNYNNLTIANNEFVNLSAGCHIQAFGNQNQNNNPNLLCEQNYFTGMKGMGFELQGNGSNVIVQDNYFENPSLSSIFANNSNSMAHSVPMDLGSNITIQRNTILAPQRPDGIGCRIGIETGGDNTLVTENYINGINQSIADNDGNGESSVTVTNNLLLNQLIPPSQSFPAPNRTWSASNNGPNIELNWDTTRSRPHRNIRFGTTPAPAPLPIGFALGAIPSDSQTIDFTLVNIPATAETITISCISTVGREVGAKVGPALIVKTPATTFTQAGFHPGWQITFFAVALDQTGKFLNESTTIVTMPGDSTVAWPPQ